MEVTNKAPEAAAGIIKSIAMVLSVIQTFFAALFGYLSIVHPDMLSFFTALSLYFLIQAIFSIKIMIKPYHKFNSSLIAITIISLLTLLPISGIFWLLFTGQLE